MLQEEVGLHGILASYHEIEELLVKDCPPAQQKVSRGGMQRVKG